MLRPCTFAILLLGAPLPATEPPYFVTYSHQMEEPGSLELALSQAAGAPRGGHLFSGGLLELEYGLRGWWTTEFYLSGQGTRREGALFTGYRFENRFRPLMREHWINPVLYVEFADINAADKTLKEIVGHDSYRDQLEPNSETRLERERELETKLILSSNFKGWNVSENLIAEKNLSNEPWEFGYAVGASRPLALAARPDACTFCRENFRAGLELYGGLGTRHEFGLRGTSHYAAPTVAWEMPNGTRIQASVGFGLTGNSQGRLVRVGISHEVNQFGRGVRRLLRTKGGDRQPPESAGAKLYTRHCAACHEAGRAPAIARDTPPDRLFDTLTHGVLRRGMPSWSHLPEQQRWQIVEYLRNR